MKAILAQLSKQANGYSNALQAHLKEVKEFTMTINNANYEPEVTEEGKKPFEEPKLSYVKPKLSEQGKVSQVTQSFFGSFSP